MKKFGFLPIGLFERLICRSVNLSKVEEIHLSCIKKDFAILSCGKQSFQLTNIIEYNCVKVDVDGEYPITFRLTNVY